MPEPLCLGWEPGADAAAAWAGIAVGCFLVFKGHLMPMKVSAPKEQTGEREFLRLAVQLVTISEVNRQRSVIRQLGFSAKCKCLMSITHIGSANAILHQVSGPASPVSSLGGTRYFRAKCKSACSRKTWDDLPCPTLLETWMSTS